jgi:intein/homing endonuclease
MRVQETYVRQSTELIHESTTLVRLTIEDTVTMVTPEHPYWVPNRGWVHAQDLQPGDQLHGITDEPVIVHQAIINPQDSPITVYNFEVKDYHTYYAGFYR